MILHRKAAKLISEIRELRAEWEAWDTLESLCNLDHAASGFYAWYHRVKKLKACPDFSPSIPIPWVSRYIREAVLAVITHSQLESAALHLEGKNAQYFMSALQGVSVSPVVLGRITNADENSTDARLCGYNL